MTTFSQQFPPSLYKFHKLLGVRQEEAFVRYVVCQICSMVYDYDSCIEKNGMDTVPLNCKYRFSGRESPCNGALLRCMELRSKKQVFYPYRVFCYMPLKFYLKRFLSRPNFDTLCSEWKNNVDPDGVYKDVYDGQIWKDFQEYNGIPFLSKPYTYGLMMNIDWFKPCKHTEYSLGAIYLTIMNLPRRLRFRQENVMLIGLIPGPKEPKRDINPFLVPLVKELMEFLHGVEIYIKSLSKAVLVRCALLCIACDIPASRKVCGLLGHSATLGCSKCLKHFPGSVGQKDYSGFNRSQWKSRTLEDHRKCINQIRKCTTKMARNELESKYGCRYSELLQLPYFDPIRMTIIDPMHNLYLGTTKCILKVWIEQQLIDNKAMGLIQSIINNTTTPHYVGRIPLKIASSFSGFTADQFKNWANLFSIMALSRVLPTEHMKCWCYFVQASRILCQMSLTHEQVLLADAFLLRFCQQVEILYGKQAITPNMHLHCHLKQCVFDYGPIHNFWLFSYERYNGILENFPSNNRSLEIHLMQRFIQECSLYSAYNTLPDIYHSDFQDIFQKDLEPTLQGSLQVTIHGSSYVRFSPSNVTNWTLSSLSNKVSFPKSYHRSVLSDDRVSQLKHVYTAFYPFFDENEFFNTTCKKYSSIVYNGVHYKEQSVIYSTINCFLFDNSSTDLDPRPALIKHFLVHSCQINNVVKMHAFAIVSWLKEHHSRSIFVKPFEIWWKDLYDLNLEDVIPIQLLICHAVHCDYQYEAQTVYLLCPVYNILPL